VSVSFTTSTAVSSSGLPCLLIIVVVVVVLNCGLAGNFPQGTGNRCSSSSSGGGRRGSSRGRRRCCCCCCCCCSVCPCCFSLRLLIIIIIIHCVHCPLKTILKFCSTPRIPTSCCWRWWFGFSPFDGPPAGLFVGQSFLRLLVQ